MLSSLACSLASSSACFTHAPMLGAVGAVANHLRPWLASCRFSQRRNIAAQALQAVDSDSDVDQQPMSVLTHPASDVAVKPAPVPAVSGRIHSVDTFSAVDGPGLRMVVFEQVSRFQRMFNILCFLLACDWPDQPGSSKSTTQQLTCLLLCAVRRVVPCAVPSAATPTPGHHVGGTQCPPKTSHPSCAGVYLVCCR